MKKIFAFLIVNCQLSIINCFAAQYGRDVQQAMALQAAAAQYAPAPDPYAGALPVRVLGAGLEADIRAGNHATSLADLERCKMVWPNGVFVWGAPDAGDGITNMAPTCLAEVYLKAAPKGQQAGINGGVNDKIVAVAYVPAGGTIKCNIGSFPQSGYLPAAGDVIFPADNPPSVEEVEAVMDKENKQNAVMKTASAALIGGFGMFLASDGTEDKGKRAAMIAAGTVGAGGLAFGSTQVGKVAGDTMLSAGTNAAVGAVMGNMSAGTLGGGDAILAIKDCDAGKCLWGYVRNGIPLVNKNNYVYGITSKKLVHLTSNDDNIVYTAADKNIYDVKILVNDGIAKDGLAFANEMSEPEWRKYLASLTDGMNSTGLQKLFLKKEEGDKYEECTEGEDGCEQFVMFDSAKEGVGQTMLAMKELPAGVSEGFFGIKLKDYRANPDQYGTTIVGRYPDGKRNNIEREPANAAVFADKENFVPLTIMAEDGDVIEFGNRARMGSTLIGAGSGAAVGALASFQNARAEVQERYLVELENYEGTLANFYCITGTRYLDKYNNAVVIPGMK